MADRSTRRRRNRRALALAITAGGALAMARRASGRLSWATGEDPCGPDGFALPAGEERTITVDDGAELAVTIAGPDDGPAVVLAHCWTGSRAFWSPVARRLVASGHRVVLYDQRGHGASTFGGGRTDLERLGEDLRTILEELELTDVVLAGHSMGGMTIQAFAKEHPDELRARARAVVLVATAAKIAQRGVPDAAIDAAIGAAIGDRAIGSWFRGPAGIRMTRGALGAVAHRSHVEATRDHFIDTLAAARTGFLAGMLRMDLRSGHLHIEVPTTIIVGTQDRLTPVPLAKLMAAGIAKAELIVVPQAGHMLPIEEPIRVADAIEAHTAIGEAKQQAAAS